MTEKSYEERLAEEKAWLVGRGNEVGGLAGGISDWKNQIGVLQAAAAKETEPLVMLNLLRYQAARRKPSWEATFQTLYDAMEACRARSGDDAALAMLLIRHLLLYSSRAYTYENKWERNGGTP